MSVRWLLALLFVTGLLLAEVDTPVPSAGNVTLRLEDYDNLLKLASQPQKKLEAPPVPHVMKSAKFDLAVKGEAVFGSMLLEGEVLMAGERKVPLVSGMIVLDAQQGGAELPLGQENGVLSALLPGPGAFAVTLKTGTTLGIETGRASFTLPVPVAGAAQMTLSLPGEQTAVNLSPGLITGRSSRGGRTIVEATLVPGQMATLWWAARLPPSLPVAPKEVRFLSDVKTLISVSDSEVAMAALAEVTVVQGEPSQFMVLVPDGYQLTGATGPTLTSSDVLPHAIRLDVSNAGARTHQFLISFARSNNTANAETPLVTFQGAQRETGEVLIEGEGAMELNAAERGGLRRMDLKETSPYLRSLARTSLHAAFRYQKKPAELPGLSLNWTRFPDSAILSAVAQQAVVTTLVTSEGRSLTEVKLTVKNQAQPFLKVGLPAGASILSAEVAGEKVKPVQGADGNRVPLLRPGFRPVDAYVVSFVFLHAGAAFGKKGEAEMALPKMDIPIGLVEWEVFLPKRYKVGDLGGDVMPAHLLPASPEDDEAEISLQTPVEKDAYLVQPGQIGGTVTDTTGAAIPRASIHVVHLATGMTADTLSDPGGRWVVANIPSGQVRITMTAPGFRSATRQLVHDPARGTSFRLTLQVGNVTETIEVTANTPPIRPESQQSQQKERNLRQNAAPLDDKASANVADLQRRVVGVLPIAVNVPRTGNSYRVVRPLVIDEETRLTFTYSSK